MFDFWGYLEQLLALLHSPLGAILFIPLYALWVTLLLPGAGASIFAGAIFGIWEGSVLVFLGAFLGAQVTFWLGRTFLRDWLMRRLAVMPKLQAVEKAVSREGLKLVLLTRLSPAFPFSLLNLAYGLSNISFRDFSIGLIGIIPGTIFFCNLGYLAGGFAHLGEAFSDRPSQPVLRFVGILATFAVVWFVGRAARGALQESEPSI